MDAREFGRETARRWTGLIAAGGIALTGLVGVGTYHALEAAKTGSAASGTTSTTTSSDDSGTTGSSDDSGTATATSGLSAGSGTSQTGSSGS